VRSQTTSGSRTCHQALSLEQGLPLEQVLFLYPLVRRPHRQQTLTLESGLLLALDELEEWIREKPVPYTSNDMFSHQDIFHYWVGSLSGHVHVNQTVHRRTLMSLECGDSSMVGLHLEVG
jgi:hypothetical protein